MSSALHVLSQRGKTQTEIERENFEKFQTSSIQKAINNVECPVKEKHVRTAIIGTFQDGGSHMFWAVSDKLQLQGNPIICWKFCYTLHKLLRDGHESVIPESLKFSAKLIELGKLWGHLKDSYGKLIKFYTKLLNQKLAFHKKYPNVPGNLKLTDDDFERVIGRDVDCQFEVSVDMLDYMDDLLALQAAVFSSLDMSRSNSMTSSGQCRLAPLVQCILESALLYDYIVKLLFKLHSSLPVDTLSGHRNRFSQQFKGLSQFYHSSKNLQYYKTLIHVPSLPEQAPNFLIASDITYYNKPVAVLPPAPPEPEIEALVETAQEKAPPLPDRSDRSYDDDKRHMKHEIEALRRRLRTMESDSHFELNQCTEDLRRRTREIDQMKCLLDKTMIDRDQLLTERGQQADEYESRLQNSDKTVAASDEKFKKMKDIYNKLREDHVGLLRTNADVQKHLKKLKHELRDNEQMVKEVQGQLDLAKNERSMMEETMQQSGDSTNELVEARALALQLEQEKNDIMARLNNAEQAKLAAEESLNSSEEQLKDVEMSKMNLETNIRELEEKFSDLTTGNATLEQSTQQLQTQMNDLTTKEEKARVVLVESEAKVADLQASVGDLQTKLVSESETFLNRISECRRDLLVRAIEQCSSVIQDRLQQLEEPSIFTVRSSAEFLIERINPAIQEVNEVKESVELYLSDSSAASRVIKSLSAISYRIADCILFGRATSHSAPVEFSEDLAETSKLCGENAVKLLDSILQSMENSSEHTLDVALLHTPLEKMLDLAENVRPTIKDVKDEEIGELVEQEMTTTTSAIEQAAAHFEELLAKSRSEDTGIRLEVNEKIIDSCTGLMKNIRILIEKSRTLQKEIVATGRGANSVEDFYKKHSRWTEGLLSGSKTVAFAANALLEAANNVVKGEGKFEELIVCSQEIAACTTQLVVSSQVKAEAKSKALQDLKKASSGVTKATGNVVANAKSCAKIRDEQQMQDLSNISLTQSKRMEMNSQVRVIELESALANERVKLSELRKKHYQLAGESEGWEAEDIAKLQNESS